MTSYVTKERFDNARKLLEMVNDPNWKPAMIELTPNKARDGETCGTCRFASTHTVAEDRRDQVVIRCRRYPPTVQVLHGPYGPQPNLQQKLSATHWPYTTWDDWCGEWVIRDSDDATPGPMGFGDGS